MLTPPLSATELTLALVAGAATRGLLVGLVTAVTSAGFMAFSTTPMQIANLGAIVYFSTAAALLFGMLGVVGGIWAEKFDQLAAITNFIITPLTFLSGTFYAIASLPEPFLTLSKVNPVFYLIDGFRFGFTGVSETPIMTGAILVLVLNVIFAFLCFRLFKSGWKLKS